MFVLAAALLFPAVLSAEENESSDLLRYYDSELFQWDYNTFSGLTLNFQNQNVSPIYGIAPPMKAALLQYPDSAKEYKSYRWKSTAGNVLFWGGFIATVGIVVVPIYMDEIEWIQDPRRAEIVADVLAVGLISEMIGFMFMSLSQNNIYRAVKVYNRNRIGDYK
ncbi:MAG: hypothetical protein LBK61_02485 [Spirochaetaceae bacterium]|jgi:hypothetical protein|nr:hypothetical protein [Spirochaetaceae bacterium]